MRIAFCLLGIVGYTESQGRGKPIDYRIGYEYHKKHIFDVNDNVDVFMHSWSTDFKNELVDIYKPKKYNIEEQITFDSNNLRLQSVKSRWYSTKTVLDLKSEYEKENNFEYDFVMLYRFDSTFFKPVIFDNYNNKFVYISHSSKEGCKPYEVSDGLDCGCFDRATANDQWIFGSSKNIDTFRDIYDVVEDYDEISPHKEFKNQLMDPNLKQKLKFVFCGDVDYSMIRTWNKNCEYK